MQGFNMGRYVPPDLEGQVSFNQASGKGHALGSRARKIKDGILTVRFELPFSIWCTTCEAKSLSATGKAKPQIIGQGVRFNAEKKQVGKYFSTPIYAFRMKHTLCDGWIEIRTDPKNTAYVVTEGARQRDTGGDGLKEGEIVIGARTEEEKKRLEADPFAALEQKVGDRKVAESEKTRVEELYRANSRDWDDPGEANRRLRRTFRVERKVREKKGQANEALQDRLGLSVDLVDEADEDRQRAALVDFGDAGDADGASALAKVQAQPLFKSKITEKKEEKKRSSRGRKPTSRAETSRESLQKQLGNNTRAVLDPFVHDPSSRTSTKPFRKLLRKSDQSEVNVKEHPPEHNKAIAGIDSLVDYDSD